MEKPVNICICIPVDDGARHEFFNSLMHFMARVDELFDENVRFTCKQNLGDSLITRARNNVVHDALKSEADYLLFLDTDLDFQPEDIKRLVDRRREDALICGQYAIKQPEFRLVQNALKGEQIGPDDLLKVAEAGTGCMLIPRKILETFKEKFPSLEYTDDAFKDKRFSFFDVGVITESADRRRYYSEDYLFCRRVRQLGFSVYVDTGILLGHHGWVRYPLPDDWLIKAVASRCTSPELLKHFQDAIDIAAQEQWKKLYGTSSQQELEKSKDH